MKQLFPLFKTLSASSVITLLVACGGDNDGANQDQSRSLKVKPTSHIFAANNGIDGTELFTSDGTESGTKLIKNINPTGSSNIEQLVKLGNKTCFSADNGTHGQELWCSDGTANGTQMVTDIEPGATGSSPRFITKFDNRLFFVAYESTTRNELWVSDGTSTGTKLFKEFVPGAFFDGTISNLTVFKGMLFFAATSGGANSTGVELWKTDGTTSGTALVKDISPGSNSSNPQNFAVVGNNLFFTAINSNSSGRDLWKSDGTNAGTQLVKDMSLNNPDFNQLTAVGNNLFFVATDNTYGTELWVSDGTTQGTKVVKDINNGMIALRQASTPPSSNPDQLTEFGGKLIFTANDGSHGIELWKSDGTSSGTSILKDINTFAGNHSYPDQLTVIGNSLIFGATEAGGHHSIWTSDGTEAGTNILIDLTQSGQDNRFSSLGSQYIDKPLLLVDGKSALVTGDTGNNDVQLFRTNGTASGTKLVKIINLSGDAF